MKGIIALLFCFIFLMQSYAQTWTGAVSNSWNVAGNWDINAVPGASTSVVIPGSLPAGRPWPVMVANINIGSLTMQTGSRLNTGGFNVNLNNTGGNPISITGAIITNAVVANTTTFTTGEGGGQSIDGSTFNGNFNFVVQSTNGNQEFAEATTAPNTWNGNFSITARNSNGIFLSSIQKSAFNGNVSITKLDPSSFNSFEIFTGGSVTILGDLTINKPVSNSSPSRIGNQTTEENWVQVNGRLNINMVHNGEGTITIRRIRNNTTGGNVFISGGSGSSSIWYGEWRVTKVTVTDIRGQFTFNDMLVVGQTEFSSVEGPNIFMSSNTFNGPFSIALTDGTLAESFVDANAGNIYKGDAFFDQSGTSVMELGVSDTCQFERNFTFKSNANYELTRVRFAGGENGTITKQGSGRLSIREGELIKTNGARVILASPVSFTVDDLFKLTSGYFQSSLSAPIILNNLVSFNGGSLGSHVIGPIVKVGRATNSTPFTYPIGSGFTYNPITQSNHGGDEADSFRAQYILKNPRTDGLNPDSKQNSLSNISKGGYWQFNRVSGNQNVNLVFGLGTNPYHEFPALANLRLAQWTGSQWDDRGNGGTTGTAANGTITHSGGLSTYTFFALANQLQGKYWYVINHPGTGPDGTPVKVKAVQGFPGYQTRQLPAGTYSSDSIYLVPNGSSTGFKLRDLPGVEKDDTTYTLSAPPPINYVMANATGTMDFAGWRHFVYVRNPSNEIIGAIADNNLTLGTATMQAFFATGSTAIVPNGGRAFLKRSFRVTSTLSPSGARRVRLFISKTELADLVAADPTGLPNGINSLHVYRYTGAVEQAVFNPRPGGTTEVIIPSAINKIDLGTMWALDVEVTGFSGFYLAGLPNVIAICPGSNLQLSATAPGATFRWQVSTGGDFTNLTNNATYSGVSTAMLTISNAASSLYGSTYRCVVNNNTTQPTTQVIFRTTWLGTANGQWNNPANWPCGVIPDSNTDVVVKTGVSNNPSVNANTTIRTLTIESGTTVQVANGVVLTVLR